MTLVLKVSIRVNIGKTTIFKNGMYVECPHTKNNQYTCIIHNYINFIT